MADKKLQDRHRVKRKREDEERRDVEQLDNTVRRRQLREMEDVRDAEQQKNTIRRRQVRQIEDRRDAEQQQDRDRRRQARDIEEVRDAEQQQNTARRRQAREIEDRRDAEQQQDTARRRQTRDIEHRRDVEQKQNTERRINAREEKISTFDKSLEIFRARNKEGPVHVCLCCGGIFFQKSITSTSWDTLVTAGCSEMFLEQIITAKPVEGKPVVLCSRCREGILKAKVNFIHFVIHTLLYITQYK